MSLRATLPDVVRGLGLGPDAVIEPAAGGASGSAWRVRTAGDAYVLRLESSTALTDTRLAAMATALAAGLPAPRLIRRETTAEVDAVLTVVGFPVARCTRCSSTTLPARRRWGRLMGEMQRRLHELVAPTAVIDALDDGVHPFAAGRAVADLPVGDALLHLDWHPLNLLVDEASRISGIIDWDNARRGHPSFDLARTHSLLTVEPSIAALPAEHPLACGRAGGGLGGRVRPRGERDSGRLPRVGGSTDARRPGAPLHSVTDSARRTATLDRSLAGQS